MEKKRMMMEKMDKRKKTMRMMTRAVAPSNFKAGRSTFASFFHSIHLLLFFSSSP